MLIRVASLYDLPSITALINDEGKAIDPGTIELEDAYVQAFHAIDADPRNELLVLEDVDHAVIGCLQITYIPGLGRGGGERALLEGIRIRSDRRGSGHGRRLVSFAIDRARARGCELVQLMSNKRRNRAHHFYASLGFTNSHEGFKLDTSR